MKLNLSLVDQHRGNGVSSSLTIGYKIRKRSSKLRVGSWLRQKDIVVIVLVWWFEDVFAMFSVAELRPGNTCGCMMLLLFMEVKNKVFKWTCEQGKRSIMFNYHYLFWKHLPWYCGACLGNDSKLLLFEIWWHVTIDQSELFLCCKSSFFFNFRRHSTKLFCYSLFYINANPRFITSFECWLDDDMSQFGLLEILF